MSRQTFIFVGAMARDDDLVRMIERTLGASFKHEEGSDPYVRVGSTAVYLGGHEFDDDDIAWPAGSDIPLHSDYPAMLEIRDTGRRPATPAGDRRSALPCPEISQPLARGVYRRHAKGTGQFPPGR